MSSITRLKNLQKIVVTGGNGFLGRHLIAELLGCGVARERIFIPERTESDLRKPENCRKALDGAELVFHLAATIGGIGYGQKHPAELFYDNVTMGLNLIEAARQAAVKKTVVAGTVCSYPQPTPLPFREENLWNGYPEETNAPYGVAKRVLVEMLSAYRKQYGFKGITPLLVNLYGPHDDFNLETSHVIPALIRKFNQARRSGDSHVKVWGDGSARREFLYVTEAARALVLSAEFYDGPNPVNIGSGEEISIRELAAMIREKTGFTGEILWEKDRPTGQDRRRLDVSGAERQFGFRSRISLSEGLDRTIEWWTGQGMKAAGSQKRALSL